MADSARRIFSFKGLLAERIEATQIKGREDARKKGPFLGDDNCLFYWKKGSPLSDGRRKRPHFSHYPLNGGEHTIEDLVRRELKQHVKAGESTQHKRAKAILGENLKRMIAERRSLQWHFNDADASDFSFSGDLLAGAKEVVIDNYSIKLPFGGIFRPDIAILGDVIDTKKVLLGIIEIEFRHEAELLKCLLCKSTGTPLVTIDLKDATEEEINHELLLSRLTETTHTSNDQRRRNYVFLHNMLYPVFSDAPHVPNDSHHQYLAVD